MFNGVNLTEAEKRELTHKQNVYELCKKKSEDIDYMNEYRIPESYDVNQNKRFSVASQIDRDLDDDRLTKKPVSEQKAWEEQQIAKGKL